MQIVTGARSLISLFSKAEMLAAIGEKERAIKQYEEILEWLEEHGYNVELEGVSFPVAAFHAPTRTD